jgi:hypothetical protein
MLTLVRSPHYVRIEQIQLQSGLPIPNEGAITLQFLRQGIVAPELATSEDFSRSQSAISKGKIMEKTAADSLNTIAE